MKEFDLKPGLILGVSTSATQIDGGSLDHTWDDWYQSGRIKGGANPAIAADHRTRWREDILLMHRLGIGSYRFSIEWARIEPEEGQFDEAAIAHVKEELMLLIALSITPLVTLHHFTNPMWFEAKGGWENPENITFFVRYVQKVVESIGHLAREYITINEPNVYAQNGYRTGIWPPGKRSLKTTFSVMSSMAEAHIKTYRLIHDVRRSLGFRDTKASCALGFCAVEPKNKLSPADKLAATAFQKNFQEVIALAVTKGEFKSPLKSSGRIRSRIYCDFHAISYSMRHAVSPVRGAPRRGANKSDLGWEILPSGIISACSFMQRIAPMPIYITENGVCDNEDAFRCKFIYDHLQALCTSRLDVRRYYHKGFTDGFEWTSGTSARFGIVSTDFGTMARSVKKSGIFYSKVIKAGGVTEALYDEFVAPESYHG